MSKKAAVKDFGQLRDAAVDNAQAVIALAFTGWGQAWWSDDSGDVLAKVAAEALAERGLLRGTR